MVCVTARVRRWSRASRGSDDLEVVDGANAPWYKVSREDVGRAIVVTVTSVFEDGQYGPTSSARTRGSAKARSA